MAIPSFQNPNSLLHGFPALLHHLPVRRPMPVRFQHVLSPLLFVPLLHPLVVHFKRLILGFAEIGNFLQHCLQVGNFLFVRVAVNEFFESSLKCFYCFWKLQYFFFENFYIFIGIFPFNSFQQRKDFSGSIPRGVGRQIYMRAFAWWSELGKPLGEGENLYFLFKKNSGFLMNQFRIRGEKLFSRENLLGEIFREGRALELGESPKWVPHSL